MPPDLRSVDPCRLLGKLKSYTVEGTPVEGPLSLSISVPRGFPQTHMQEVGRDSSSSSIEGTGA